MGTPQEIIYKLALTLPAFLLAITFHEFAHGWMAHKFGDNTAESQGRLTFDPLAHIDPYGTIIWPAIGLVMGWPIIGWAKPVPINPSRFSSIKKGIFWVSFAGPLSNIFLAILGSIAFALIFSFLPQVSSFKKPLLQIFDYFIFINVILAGFNLIPIPPLDGSKMLSVVLPPHLSYQYLKLERYSSFLIWGIILLSYTGVNILGRVLSPFFILAGWMKAFFVHIFI